MSATNARDGRGFEKNRPAPPSSFSNRAAEKAANLSSRKVRNVTTAADYSELERSYTFVPPPSNNNKTGSGGGDASTWQERMVQHYHSHLYKEYVLADLRRLPQIGLRWRTQAEVQSGKGHSTCGNKHCPSYLDNSGRTDLQGSNKTNNRVLLATYYQSAQPAKEVQERLLLEGLPCGLGLHDYEVNFAYVEGGEQKNELVKLRLCLRCAPKLFQTKGGALGARRAREAATERNTAATSDGTKEAAVRTSSEEESSNNRKQGKSKGKARKRRKREEQVFSSSSDEENSKSHSSHSRRSRHRPARRKESTQSRQVGPAHEQARHQNMVLDNH